MEIIVNFEEFSKKILKKIHFQNSYVFLGISIT